ncbi:MAG: V-type ATP synthase subunit A, partial [Actinobacteria bacterium]|nr:V-type ATP synthase subunit A [Actinomycetota bacterium]
YITKISENWAELVDPSFKGLRELAMSLLQKESELEEIVRLIGVEALSSRERLVMEGARSVREDFLQQNAFDDVDTYSSLRKQFLLLRLIMTFYEEAGKAIAADVEIGDVLAIPVREEIAVAKFIAEENLDEFDVLERKVTEEIDGLIKEKAEREAEKEKGEKVPEGA